MVELEYKVIKEKFIPIAEAKEILDSIEEKGYEQKLALEHAKRFGKTSKENIEKIKKALESLELRKLKEEQIIKIIDLMPKDISELKIIFAHAELPFKEEELQMIINALNNAIKG